MTILTVPSGPFETNAYLLLEEERKEALLIDAPPESFVSIRRLLEEHQCTLKGVLITHGHYDHIEDVSPFQKEGVPVYAHEEGRQWLEKAPEMTARFAPGISVRASTIDRAVEDQQRLTFLGISLVALYVPGHCPGHLCFHFPEKKVCFVGDSIFLRSVGRTDLPGGNRQMLIRSIKEKILTLPPPTTLFPGHGPPTTVGEELKENPFL